MQVGFAQFHPTLDPLKSHRVGVIIDDYKISIYFEGSRARGSHARALSDGLQIHHIGLALLDPTRRHQGGGREEKSPLAVKGGQRR